MNSELGAKLVDWALLTFSVVVVTYVVCLPLGWMAVWFWLDIRLWESNPPSPAIWDAQAWCNFIRAFLWLPLANRPWLAFGFSVIALGVGRDIYQSFKAKS